MEPDDLIGRVTALEDTVEPARKKSDRPAVDVKAGALLGLVEKLLREPDLAFDMLLAHTAVDWLDEGEFELVYQLYSTHHRHYLQVSVFVPRDNPVVPTVSGVWPVAEWQEREVYDLFGVLYDDHPDLRRILLEDDWEGFPLRKDYQDDFMLSEPEK